VPLKDALYKSLERENQSLREDRDFLRSQLTVKDSQIKDMTDSLPAKRTCSSPGFKNAFRHCSVHRQRGATFFSKTNRPASKSSGPHVRRWTARVRGIIDLHLCMAKPPQKTN